MSQHDLPDSPEKMNEQIIAEAVGELKGFGSAEVLGFRNDSDPRQTSPEKLIKPLKMLAFPSEGPRKLTFFGVTHGEEASITALRDDLRDGVLKDVDPEKIAFMIEGRHSERPYDREQALKDMDGITSIEEAIDKFGESGVALWCVADYARRNPPITVEISSPEAPESDIANLLKSEFGADDIAAYLTLRQWTTEFGGRKSGEYSTLEFVKQAFHFSEVSGVDWIRDKKTEGEIRELMKDGRRFREYGVFVGQQFLDGLNAKLGLSITLEQLQGRQQDDVLMQAINDGMSSELSDRWNTERDKFLVKEIGNAMIRGKKPYVIFGASHAVHCEPALQKLVELAK